MSGRIAFTGGRDYQNAEAVQLILDLLDPDHVLVGDATGLDSLVRERTRWARLQVFDADWRLHGRSAGPIRNRVMLEARPNLLIAFPGGRGTEDCVRQAKSLGILVLRVEDVQ